MATTPTRAEKLYLQAARFENLRDYENLCKTLVDLSLVQNESGNLAGSKNTLERCLKVLDQIHQNDVKHSVLGMLGVTLSQLGDFKKSNEYFFQSIQVMEQEGVNPEEQIHCMFGIAKNYVALGFRDDADEQFKEVQAFAKKLVLPQEELDAIASRITLLEEDRKCKEVIPLYTRALDLFKLTGDTQGIQAAHQGLARAFLHQGDAKNAMIHLKEAEKLN